MHYCSLGHLRTCPHPPSPPHPSQPPGPHPSREQLCAEQVGQSHRVHTFPCTHHADPPQQSPRPVLGQRQQVISVSLCDLPHPHPGSSDRRPLALTPPRGLRPPGLRLQPEGLGVTCSLLGRGVEMAMNVGRLSPARGQHCLPPSLQRQKEKAYLQAADHCHPRGSPWPGVPSAPLGADASTTEAFPVS